MNIKRPWIVAGATLAMAGFAGAGIAMASDDMEVHDPRPAPVVQLTGDRVSTSSDTANSADSPGEPGHVAPAPAPAPPQAADSGDSPTPAPAPPRAADSANSPAPAPVPVAADSGDSPAPAPARPPVRSDDSAGSGASAD